MAAKEYDHLDELVRLQVLGLRRSVSTQAEAITELSRAGFSNSRIAELLGTTPATVTVAVNRVKKRSLEAGSKQEAQ